MKFLLATTDPQKLPVTILSRCLQFHLKVIDVEVIRGQLEKYCWQSKSVVMLALQLLARAADGSMRDALSLTDQAVAMGDGHVTTTLFPNYKFIRLGIEDKQGLSKLFEQEKFDKVMNLAAQAGYVIPSAILTLIWKVTWTDF